MRGYAFILALSVLSTGDVVLAKLGAPGGPLKLPYDEPDAFQVMTFYKDAVAISDSDNDTIFECLAAHRINLDYEAGTATYTWTFNEAGGSSKPEILFQVTRGPSPGIINMIGTDDPSVKEAKLYYADDKCVVADVEYNGHQCILWTQRQLKDTVPQVCIDHFVDTCGVIVAPHRRDLCDDGEGDY